MSEKFLKRKLESKDLSNKKIKVEENVNRENLKSIKTENEPSFPLIKVISGGQTGADRSALEAAEVLKIQTGGTTSRFLDN